MRTTTLFGAVRVLLVDGKPEAHAVYCGHDGLHMGTISAPLDGSGFLFTGHVAECVTTPA